jgi:hypothetical protein
MKIFLLLTLFLTSCSLPGNLFSLPSNDQRLETLNILNKNSFKEEILETPYFEIYSLNKIKNSEKVIIYIEGDGVSWIDRSTISSNPTPTDPLAFRLAKIDNNDNIIYLARPCQYIEGSNCNNNEIWTISQYSDAVLSSYKGIIDKYATQFNEIHLVGYSGGAGIAMYLGSTNSEKIKSIRTIAGNINHNRLSQLIKISPLSKSISFYEIEDMTIGVPQVHYIGNADKVIPKELSLSFKNSNKTNKCIKIQDVDATHNKRWDIFWINEHSNLPSCS